jgi:hypothetical protein
MRTITNFAFGNITSNPIAMVFLSDGSIQQVNTQTLAVTAVAPVSTIANPTNNIGLSQWGSQYILMAAPQTNGYFIWDGTLLYEAGTLGPSTQITSDGNTYTSQPNMRGVGGLGFGAAFAATVTSSGALSNISLTATGTSYGATDVVMIAFSGGGAGTSATAIIVASLSGVSGSVGALTVLTGGSGYTPAGATLSLQGGGGIGATATATVAFSGGPITGATIVNAGLGYLYPPTVVVTDANNPVAQATVPIMPFGVQGTALETYNSRVWTANGAAPVTPPQRNLQNFSAPGIPSDFNPSDGAGTYLNNNSFARVGYYGLKQSNGFLYEIGDSSVDYISGVQTTGTPPITTFNNQNIDPQVGSPWASTVQVFSRAIVFANPFGVHALYGGAVQKISNQLDGIFTSLPITGNPPTINGIQPSAAVAVVFGIHIYCILLPVIDTYTGETVNKIFCWDGQLWFSYQPSVPLIQIASQEINSVLTAYGTDGTNIYPLFATPSTAIQKVVQSKQWDNPSYLMIKQVQRILGLLKDDNIDNFNVSVDTENGSVTVSLTNGKPATWLNNQGQSATWYNNAGQVATWYAAGNPFFIKAIDATGVITGLTFYTNAEDMTLISLMLTGRQMESQL